MELVKVKCPECGASIEINNKLENAACNYCGTSFVIKKENNVEKTLKTFDEHSERKKKLKTDYLEKLNKIRDDAMKSKNASQAEQWKMINDNKWFFIGIFGFMAFVILLAIISH